MRIFHPMVLYLKNYSRLSKAFLENKNKTDKEIFSLYMGFIFVDLYQGINTTITCNLTSYQASLRIIFFYCNDNRR